MKQKAAAILFFLLFVVVLVGLNAVSHVQKEKTPDIESLPNRSTYNSGATGTQALYSLLTETGRRVTRWNDPPSALLTARPANRPAVFVMVGRMRRPLEDGEAGTILSWVSDGGRLVIIDRSPPEEIVPINANWRLSVSSPFAWPGTVDPANQYQMTLDTPAVRPAQPSVITHSVNAVQPSRLAGSVGFEWLGAAPYRQPPPPSVAASPEYDEYGGGEDPDDETSYDAPPPPAIGIPTRTPVDKGLSTSSAVSGDEAVTDAPVVHFGTGTQALVAEVPYGSGRVTILTDPYVVSNAGIALADNTQLAINLLSTTEGIIAFDEYHQGYGSGGNRLLAFFSGTPVVAIFLQAAVLVGLVLYSRSRRFARPVPETEPDRLSKLEYVSAMAELQNRAKAYDLALENLYSDFKRRVARLFGMDAVTAKSSDLAPAIAERTGRTAAEVEQALFSCEEIIRGASTNSDEVVALAATLRAIEDELGLARGGRGTA